MARRLLILSVLSSIGLLVVSFTETTVFAATNTYPATTVTGLNDIFNRPATAANVVANNDTVSLTITVDPLEALRVDTIPMDSTPVNTRNVNYNLNVEKRGLGIWRLGDGKLHDDATGTTQIYTMDNILRSGTGANSFAVSAGFLDLMRGTNLTFAGGAALSDFTLKSGAQLNFRGENTLKPAGRMVLENNSTLGFDLTHVMDPDFNKGVALDTPIVTISGVSITKTNPTDKINLDLLGFADIEDPKGKTVALITYTYTPTVPPGETAQIPPPLYIGYAGDDRNPAIPASVELLVRGEKWADVVAAAGGRLSGTLDQDPTPPATNPTTTLKISNLVSDLRTVTWTGAANQIWNATSANWTKTYAADAAVNTFLHGDTVVFDRLTGGTITVQAGGVQIGGIQASGTDKDRIGEMRVVGGIYTFENAAGSVIGIDGQGKVIVDGSSTEVTFNSSNSYWGGTDITNHATVIAKSGRSLGTGQINLTTVRDDPATGGGTLVFDIDAGVTDHLLNDFYAAPGTTFVKRGDGTFHVDSPGYFSSAGDTVVEKGTLVNNVGAGLLTVYLGATYDMAGQQRMVAGLSDGPTTGLRPDGTPYPDPNGGTILMGNQDLTLVFDAESHTFSGTIKGTNTGKLRKLGTGVQVLTENSAIDGSTFDGGTQIDEGAIVVKRTLNADLPIDQLGTGDVTVAAVGTLQFDIAGDPLSMNPTELVATFANAIHGPGTVLKKAFPDTDSPRTDSAVLKLTSARSTYTGVTDVQEGTLRLGSVNATGKTVEVLLAAGTQLQFNMGDSKATLDDSYNRIITGAGNVAVMEGTTVYVNGKRSDSELVTAGAHPSASNYTGATTVEMNAALHLLNTEASGKTTKVDLLTTTSDLYLDFTGDQTYERYITGDGNLFKTGSSVTTLDYAVGTVIPNDYRGKTRVENGTLKLMYAEATGAADAPLEQKVEVSGLGILELAFDGDYNKGIWGTGAIAKSGTGTTKLKGWSSYTGGTYIYGLDNGDGTYSPGGTLSFTDTTSKAGNLGDGGVFFQRGGGTLQNTAANPSFRQRIIIDGGSTAIFETLQDMTIDGNGGISHSDLNASGLQSHLTKKGAADLTINTAAGWTGRTVVEEGRLINNIPDNTELTVTAGTEYITGNSHRTVSLLLGDGTVQTTAGYDFVVNTGDGIQNVFSGELAGGGNLVKTGDGLFVLTGGSNTYSGKTVVEAGTLRGTIAGMTALVVKGGGTYEAGTQGRAVRSLEGDGIVDMQNRMLTINTATAATSPVVFNGQIRNGQRLVKDGLGKQVFAGKYYEFSEDVLVLLGTLQIGESSATTSVFQVGGNLTVSKDATFGINPLALVDVTKKLTIDGTLDVSVGSNTIHAGEVELGKDSTINISGITAQTETKTIIQSNNNIVGQFGTVTVAGDPSTGVDYLIFGVSYEDPKAVKIGQTLRWYSGTDAHGTFTLTNPDGSYDVGVSLKDVTDPARWQKGWDGKTLTKKGPGTLVLSARNTYTGETKVEEGTLKLTNAEATLGSSRIVLGSATPNVGALELDFNGSLATPITGTGSGVYKTGNSVAVLTGKSTYTAPTEVLQGTLYVDGSLASHVWVDAGAGFGGNGKVNETVTFRDGSYFDWRFGKSEADSDMLTVSGVRVGNDVYVRPNTNIPTLGSLANFEGWKILHYGGALNNQFAGVDNAANPYYDFELDYSQAGYVKINGFLRHEPRALSDIVATSLVMAETKMYRSVYQQIAREWDSDCPDHPTTTSQRRINGQSPKLYRAAWMNFIGRGDQYASNYFDDKYQFQSYGVQVGFSLFSNCRTSFGIMYGREESQLGNSSDEVRGEDNYLGLYYGHAFDSGIDVRSYIGGGWQNYKLDRRSNGNLYHANYDGSTFNLDVEFGRRFITERECVLRPFVGFDLAVARIGSGQETCEANPTSNEYRNYERSELGQFLTRAGFELGKNWRRFDVNSGIQLAWNWGETEPRSRVFYPMTGGSVVGAGADLGRFDLIMNVGFNWYITEQRNTMFYVNYIGDIYLDRQGKTGSNAGTVGFSWRF